MKQIIKTSHAPKAIGTYSQGVKVGNTVFLSGQIPLDPRTMEVIEGSFKDQVRRVFDNLVAVTTAAGGDLTHVVKLTIYLTDMNCFSSVNEMMSDYFQPPYPARAVVGVTELPKGVAVEIEAILVLGE